ncbi:zinc transporter 1-like [Carcharodon carcharias]|uniref:zinc transporter 1-like n=1 Tax=Carcharodon carcharias TaxID=13397 RepID=UPI001B7DF171|nr:zinc transporter 1-like [Carcharodon carcharias]
MAGCRVGSARWVWIVLVSLFGLLELIFSQLSDSLTLLLDSFHSLSVLLALAMPVLAEWLSRRPIPSSHTFGWERLAPVGTLLADVLSLSLCCSVSVAAMARFLSPHPLHRSSLPIAVGAGGIFLNLGVRLWLRSTGSGPSPDSTQGQLDTTGGCQHPKVKGADFTGWGSDLAAARSPGGRGAHGKRVSATGCWEILTCFVSIAQSVLSSAVALVVGFLHRFPAVPPGRWHRGCLPYLDPGLSLLTALALVSAAAPRLKGSVLLLLECVPGEVDLRRLTHRLADVKGVFAVHELHVWRLSARRVLASAHVQCRSLSSLTRVDEDLRRVFGSEGIHSVTVQLELISPTDRGVCQLVCGPPCAKKLCCDWPGGAEDVANFAGDQWLGD